MGKAFSVVQRKVYKFNSENRAHKVISKDKPIPAPKHKTTANIIERIRTDHPEFLKQDSRKDIDFHGRLQHVFVKSEVPAALHSTRSLPQKREQVVCFVDADIIPQGRFTLKQALKFIGDHQSDTSTYTAAAIAEEYKLDKEKTEVILQHFKAFQLFQPEGKKSQHASNWIFKLTPGIQQADEKNK